MALKSSREFLELALTNNTFDPDKTDECLRKNYENSFSSLYRLQRSLIGYEEYFYTTRNDPDKQDSGDLYLDKNYRVCINVPACLVNRANYESARTSPTLGETVSIKELAEHPELYAHRPVILMDQKMMHNFSVEVYDDYFHVVFEDSTDFLYDKKWNEELQNYNWIPHNFVVQVIPNSTVTEITTNTMMLKRNSVSGTDVNFLRYDYFEQLGGNAFHHHEGIFFAAIYKGTENYGTTLIHVSQDKDQNFIFCYPKEVLEWLPDYTGAITIQFLFYEHLHSCGRRSMAGYQRSVRSTFFTLFDEDGELFHMPIPIENFLILKENENGTTQIPQESMKLQYPNIYHVDENVDSVDDVLRVYYFYSPDYKNLHYRYYFDFFYRYLTLLWPGVGVAGIINELYFGYVFSMYVPRSPFLFSDAILYLGALEMVDAGLLPESDIGRFFSFGKNEQHPSYQIDDIKLEWLEKETTLTDLPEEEIPIEAKEFVECIRFIMKFNLNEWRYDEVEYILEHEQTPPIEYKVAKLKSFIRDDWRVLKDYVLMQNPIHYKQEFLGTEKELQKRLVTTKEGSGEELLGEYYLFAIAKPDPYQDLSARVFINGLICTDFVYDRYEYMDYIYIPKSQVPLEVNGVPKAPYFEVLTYPSFEDKQVVTFTKTQPTIEFDYSREDDIIPTLSDIFLYLGEEFTLDKLPLKDFDITITSNRYNYYVDLSKTTTLYFHSRNGKPVDGEYFDSQGHAFTFEGQRNYKRDIPQFELIELIGKGDLMPMQGFATDDKYRVTMSEHEVSYDDVVLDQMHVFDESDTGVIYSDVIKKIQITCKKEEYFNQPITVQIAKHPYHYNHNAVGLSYPRFDINVQNTEKVRDHTSVFLNGRMICRYRYDYRKVKNFLSIFTMEQLKKGEWFGIDVCPYRRRLLLYKECIVDDPENFDLQDLRVDLRGAINKPFDPRYYEIVLNGRRLAQRQMHPISPWEVRLTGCYSIYNFELYELDRDWEYYGILDWSIYFTLSDLIRKSFVKNDPHMIKELIKLETDDPDPLPNDNWEDKEPWDKTADTATVEFRSFYYNELLPKGLADPNILQFNDEHCSTEYTYVHEAYSKFDQYGNRVYLLNPDVFYIPEAVKPKNRRWEAYMTGNGPLEELEQVPEPGESEEGGL